MEILPKNKQNNDGYIGYGPGEIYGVQNAMAYYHFKDGFLDTFEMVLSPKNDDAEIGNQDYERIDSLLQSKYGTPLGNNSGTADQLKGPKFSAFIDWLSENKSQFVSDQSDPNYKYNEWLIALQNGKVKIEHVYQRIDLALQGISIKVTVHFIECTFFPKEQIEDTIGITEQQPTTIPENTPSLAIATVAPSPTPSLVTATVAPSPTPSILGKGVPIKNGVNIRDAASENGKKIGRLTQKDTVEVLGETTDEKGSKWYQIQQKDGTVGFVSSKLLNVQPSSSTVSTPTAESEAQNTVSVSAETQSEDTIRVARGKTFKIPVQPTSGKSKTKLTWTTTDKSIATVSNGTITGRSAGQCIITSETADGIKTNYNVTCYEAVSSITFEKNSIAVSESYLSEGGVFNNKKCSTYQVVPTVKPKTATDKSLVWSSSDPSIATVTQEGLITGISEGNCTITATATDGSGKKATIKVTVEPRIGVSAETFTREGYFGIYNEFAITFKNLNKKRTVTQIEFIVTIDKGRSTEESMSCVATKRIQPKNKKQDGWWRSSRVNYMRSAEVTLMSITYSDGTYEFFLDHPIIGKF